MPRPRKLKPAVLIMAQEMWSCEPLQPADHRLAACTGEQESRWEHGASRRLEGARGWAARGTAPGRAHRAGGKGRLFFLYSMGYENSHDVVPGLVTDDFNEQNQRGMYKRWVEFMEAKSWDELMPRETPH